MDEANLILFYGPPHVGKSLFHATKLQGYVRIEPALEFSKDPSLTLRQLIVSRVVSNLNEGKRVVVDDENSSYVKRDSYISLIKRRFPDCKIVCISFRPKHGKDQLFWNREYSYARLVRECLMNGEVSDAVLKKSMKKSDREVEKWVEDKDQLEPPRNSEGFWKMEYITTSLLIPSKYMLELPGIIIEWKGLFDRASGQLLPKVGDSLSKWCSQNMCGRILVVCDSNAISSESDDKNRIIERTLTDIAQQLDACPVYAIAINSQVDSGVYSLPPAPGLIIFLQQLHCLNLVHKGSVYVYQTPQHKKMAETIGMKYVKASNLFNHPDMVGNTHSYSTAPLPPLMQEQEILHGSSDEKFPLVPLGQSIQDGEPFSCAKLGCGRTLYLAVKSHEVLKRYKEMYSQHASLSSAKESQIDHLNQMNKPVKSKITKDSSLRDLPEWMKKGRKRDCPNVELLSDTSKKKKKKKGKNINPNAPIYVMSDHELREIATEILEEADMSLEADNSENETSNLSELL